jgi:hypothetical protein
MKLKKNAYWDLKSLGVDTSVAVITTQLYEISSFYPVLGPFWYSGLAVRIRNIG